jgi:hypothetical protein
MKSKVVSLVVLWVLSLCPSVGNAQTSHHSALTVKVPFEFVVGNRTFPAGTYKFESLNSAPSSATIDYLMVRSMDGRHLYQAIVADVVGSEEPSNPRLLFTRRGDRAFLSEVWAPGKQAGWGLQCRNDHTQAAESENDKLTLIASKPDLR